MITRTQIRDTVKVLQNQGFDIKVEWAYGWPRCYTLDNRELSPRLRTGEMANWLHGYEAGANAAERRQHVRDAEQGN